MAGGTPKETCDDCVPDECGNRPRRRHGHRRHHDEYVNGIPLLPLKGVRPLVVDDLQVYVVLPTSPLPHRKRAERVGLRANSDLQIMCGVYEASSVPEHPFFPHAVIGCRDHRAVGLLILQRREGAEFQPWPRTRGMFDDEQLHRIPKGEYDRAKRWTVGYLWVLGKHRRSGVASTVLTVAASWAKTPVSKLGWQVPFLSPARESLVRHHCPRGFFVTWGQS